MEDLQRLVPRQAMLEQILPSGHMALADLKPGKRLRRSSLDRCSGWSDVRLFRHFQGVVDLDPQVSNGHSSFVRPSRSRIALRFFVLR